MDSKIKVDIWHFIYFIIILGIVLFFSLCLVPGKIEDNAYDNVSFAATITSIVLAVVSILYTLLSGFSSDSSLKEIKEVESRISTELDKFSNIEASIKKHFSDEMGHVTDDLKDIKSGQADWQRAQSESNKNIVESIQQLSNPVKDEKEVPKTTGDSGDTEPYKSVAAPYLMHVMLYTALKSQQTGLDLPINNILKPLYSVGAFIGEGYLKCLAIYKSDAISLSSGSKPSRTKVDKFNTKVLGTEDWLISQIQSYDNHDLAENTLRWLNSYYKGSDEDQIGQD